MYDFLQEPEEIIIFDKPHGRFVLLDGRRRVRAELRTGEVADFTQQLKQRAENHEDPSIKFMAAPKFDSRQEQNSGKLILSSAWMNYRIETTSAGSREVAEQYREFSDWLTRLNALLNPGSRLPFGRLAVNAILAERGAIAREVELTITPKKGSPDKPTTMRSEHQLRHGLAAADLARVKQAQQYLESFKLVGFKAYRRAAAP